MVLDRYSNPNNRLIKELLLFDILAASIVFNSKPNRAPVAQLVEHRVVTREVVSSTPAGPTLRVLK